MEIETYFGFFAKSVFTAMAATISAKCGKPVALEEVTLAATNGFKLQRSEVETVLLPRFAEAAPAGFVLALAPDDSAALTRLAAGRLSLRALMEQVVASAVEPFNFIAKRRDRLNGLQFSRNVPGLLANRLGGDGHFTMALGRLCAEKGQPFLLRLLVTAQGLERIEERAQEPHTQRALFSINEGAYVCRPQWEPPAPPPNPNQGEGVSDRLINNWVQSFFALNDGNLPPKIFKQPVALFSSVVALERLLEVEAEAEGAAVVRLVLNGEKEKEIIVVVPTPAEKSLLTLSKSGQAKFLGDFFRVLFGEAAQFWAAFGGVPFSWRVQGVGRVPTKGMGAIVGRLKGGGIAVDQEVRLDEGRVRWMVAVSPAARGAFLSATAMAMQAAGGETSTARQGKTEAEVLASTGWDGNLPWGQLVAFGSDRDLQDLIREVTQRGIREPHLAGVADKLETAARERWLAAMPVSLRERTAGYQPEEGEPPPPAWEMGNVLIAINRARKMPTGKLSLWCKGLAEMRWGARQELIDTHLPLRHLIYGMDRGSLSRALFDEKSEVLSDLLCGAEFPVLDQVRRAISPGYAVRLLEDVAIKRPRTSAFASQQALLLFYRRCAQGADEGRYLLRPTVAERLAAITASPEMTL